MLSNDARRRIQKGKCSVLQSSAHDDENSVLPLFRLERLQAGARMAGFDQVGSLALLLMVLNSPVLARQSPRYACNRAVSSSRLHHIRQCMSPMMVKGMDAAEGSASTIEDLKKQLRRMISRTRGGKKSTLEERLAIEEIMVQLERMNPTKDPALSPLVSGKWVLLYTGASKEAAADRMAKEGVVGSAVTELTGSASASNVDDGPTPFGRWLTTLAGRVIDNKGNFQDIDAENGKVVNRAELALVGVPVSISIEGRCAQVPREQTDGEAKRLNVNFERVSFQRKKSTVLQVPLTWANNGDGPFGFVDTTYLDDEMRLGRGDKGSFFVTVRRK